MDENFVRSDENTENAPANDVNAPRQENADFSNFSMDRDGNIRADRGGAAVIGTNARTFIILGWVSAAFTAFISPYFAILGIVMGVLANRKIRGSGNAIIITNVVLAVISFVFRLFMFDALRRMMIGY